MDAEDALMKRIIAHYRELAADAQDAASGDVQENFRRSYRRMAKHWNALASEIERCMEFPDISLH